MPFCDLMSCVWSTKMSITAHIKHKLLGEKNNQIPKDFTDNVVVTEREWLFHANSHFQLIDEDYNERLFHLQLYAVP